MKTLKPTFTKLLLAGLALCLFVVSGAVPARAQYTAQAVGAQQASSGTTAFFSVNICSSCGGMTQNLWQGGGQHDTTINLSNYVSKLPTDTNYQIICTYNTPDLPPQTMAISVQQKTTTSFVLTATTLYADAQHSPNILADCMYHHS
jgi:hypothetical protein